MFYAAYLPYGQAFNRFVAEGSVSQLEGLQVFYRMGFMPTTFIVQPLLEDDVLAGGSRPRLLFIVLPPGISLYFSPPKAHRFIPSLKRGSRFVSPKPQIERRCTRSKKTQCSSNAEQGVQSATMLRSASTGR